MNDLRALLTVPQFTLAQREKDAVLLPHMVEAVRWHVRNCPPFASFCETQHFNPHQSFSLEDIPYLPVTLFKSILLRSVPEGDIIKTLHSSSTSGQPSTIFLDRQTADMQAIVLQNILMDFLGKERRHFLIFDSEKTVKEISHGELSSRGTAIRGMLTLAKKFSFLLDDDLHFDSERWKKICSSLQAEESLCFFGFTWLLYSVFQEEGHEDEIVASFASDMRARANILHIGGWKKLQEHSVSKDEFNRTMSAWLGVAPTSIIDFYGMTEQLGTVYPDCAYGRKHVPLAAELIVRNPVTLDPVANGEIGLIQLLSPIPRSYPGISILSDDLGRIIGVDDCSCGRKGKSFIFEKRSETAELKGCGDTLILS